MVDSTSLKEKAARDLRWRFCQENKRNDKNIWNLLLSALNRHVAVWWSGSFFKNNF